MCLFRRRRADPPLGTLVAPIVRMHDPSTVTAADLMTRDVATAGPRWSLRELERVLTKERVSGLPVVEGDKLVGVVSRADVIRQLNVERSRAEQISEYFRGHDPDPRAVLSAVRDEERFVDLRIRDELVRDVMSPAPFVVSPQTTIREVAALLSDHHIHRVPVVDGRRLEGIVSALDIVRYVAQGLEPPAR